MKTSIWPCWQGAPMATVWEFSTYTYHTDCQLSAHPHNDRLSPIQYTPAYNTVNIYFSFCFVKDLDKSQAGFTTLTKKEDGLKFFILFLPLKMSSVNVARNLWLIQCVVDCDGLTVAGLLDSLFCVCNIIIICQFVTAAHWLGFVHLFLFLNH